MPTSRGQRDVRPVIVEVRPSAAVAATNLAPSTPSPPSSPKAVRFASRSTLAGFSRQPTSTEAWSLYHFEKHARICPQCHDPLSVARNGGHLCDDGHALAQDVALHVYHQAGEVYSTQRDSSKHVRVEIPPYYDQVRDLLKALDRHIKSTTRVAPIISYDRTYPVSPRRTDAEPVKEYDEVIIEPADSRRHHHHHHHHRSGSKSKRKANGYHTTAVIVEDHASEPEVVRANEARERRGSQYYAHRQRKAKEYDVEIREPKPERQSKEERRATGFWS